MRPNCIVGLLTICLCVHATIYEPEILAQIVTNGSIFETYHIYSPLLHTNKVLLDEQAGYVYALDIIDFQLVAQIFNLNFDNGTFNFLHTTPLFTPQENETVLSFFNPLPSVFALSSFDKIANSTKLLVFSVSENTFLLNVSHPFAALTFHAVIGLQSSFYGNIYASSALGALFDVSWYYSWNGLTYSGPHVISLPESSLTIAISEGYLYSLGQNMSLCRFPFGTTTLHGGVILCHTLSSILQYGIPINTKFQFTVPQSLAKMVLMVYADRFLDLVMWETSDFSKVNVLNIPNLLPLTVSWDSLRITFNAEIIMLRDPVYTQKYSVVDISNMAKVEVFCTHDETYGLQSKYRNTPFDIDAAVSQDGTRAVRLYYKYVMYSDQKDLLLLSLDISPVLNPALHTFLAGGQYAWKIIAAGTNAGFWAVGEYEPTVSFYSLSEPSLQLQQISINDTYNLLRCSGDIFSVFEHKFLVMLGDRCGYFMTLSIAEIDQDKTRLYITNNATYTLPTTYVVMYAVSGITSPNARFLLTYEDRYSYKCVSIFQSLSLDIVLVAQMNVTSNITTRLLTRRFDFLILQKEPTLIYAVPVQDPLGVDVVLLEFEFNYSSQTLSVAKNITLLPKCNLFQSIAAGNSTWILCEYFGSFTLHQILAPNYTVCCFLELSFHFVKTNDVKQIVPILDIDKDNKRLLISYQGTFVMYNIIGCHCKSNASPKAPVLIYNLTTAYQLRTAALYNLQSKSGVVAIGTTGQGVYQVFMDCPNGRYPTALSFCSTCIPGQSGAFCDPCPAGYLCNDFGMTIPSDLCPAGHYCEAGSFGNPPPCDAGTYCPAGVATRDVTNALNSAKFCAAGFYCPNSSSTPTSFKCPNFTYSDEGAESVWDCVCMDGFYGFGGACIQCPPKCKCSGSNISLCWIPSGFGVSDLAKKLVFPLLCPSYDITGQNQCNPNKTEWSGDGEFPCEKGYQNRMCAQCSQGYFADGRRCFECTPYLKWFLPVIYSVATILVGFVAWHDSPSGFAALKIVLFHFQFLYAIITSGLQWNATILRFVHGSSGTSSLSYMAIECLIKDWGLLGSLLFALFTPLLALLLGFCAWCASWIFALLPFTEYSEPQKAKARILKVGVFVVTLRFFDMATIFFSMFACTSYDARLEENYLNSYPWVSCSSKIYKSYLGVAVIGVIFEIVGLPLLYVLSVKSYRSRLTERDFMEVMGSMYAIYSPLHYYWEGIVISRRLLIAIVIALVPFNSSWLFFGFFIVLLSYLVTHVQYSPYARKSDNILDFFSHLVLIISLFVGLMVGVPLLEPYQSEFSIIVLIFNLGFLLLGISLIVRHYTREMWNWWNTKGKLFVQKIRWHKYNHISEDVNMEVTNNAR